MRGDRCDRCQYRFFCFFEKDEIQCDLSIGQSDIILPKQQAFIFSLTKCTATTHESNFGRQVS
jgi:hypothetical protein